MEIAPCPSDILWDNFNKKSSLRMFKIVLLNLFLFVVTVVMITPIAVIILYH